MAKMVTVRLEFKKPRSGFHFRVRSGMQGYYQAVPEERVPLPSLRGLGDLGTTLPRTRRYGAPPPPGITHPVGPRHFPHWTSVESPVLPSVDVRRQLYGPSGPPAAQTVQQVAASDLPAAGAPAAVSESWLDGSTSLFGYTVKNLYLALGAGAVGVILYLRSKRK